MERQADNEKLMIRYLLGELPEEEQIRIEERFFTNDEYFEQLLAVEDELIDDYVNGELTDHERKQFEKYFLASPKRRQRVEFARAFVRCASASGLAEVALRSGARPEPVPWWQNVMVFWRAPSLPMRFAVAASVLLILGGSWLMVETLRLRSQVERLQAERAHLQRREQELLQQIAGTSHQPERVSQLIAQLEHERKERNRLEQEVASLKQPRIPGLAFAVFPGRTRDIGGLNKLVIPQGEDSVQLRLYLVGEDQYTGYRAVIRAAEGNEVWSQDALKVQRTDSGRAVVLTLPTRVLSEGDYIITLSGLTASGDLEDVDSYQFSVVKR